MNKYSKEIAEGVHVDVYDVLKAFDVKCPAMQHAIKKMLCSGQRGVKDVEQDKREAIASIERSIQLDEFEPSKPTIGMPIGGVSAGECIEALSKLEQSRDRRRTR